VLTIDRGRAYFDDRAYERHALEEYRAVPAEELSDFARLSMTVYGAQEAMNAGRLDEARAEFRRGIEQAPFVPGCRMGLAQLELQAEHGDPALAEAVILPILSPAYRSAEAQRQRFEYTDDILVRFPGRPHELLGRAYALQKKWPGAVQELTRAVQLEKDPTQKTQLNVLLSVASERLRAQR
jgi:hypothetical protein